MSRAGGRSEGDYCVGAKVSTHSITIFKKKKDIRHIFDMNRSNNGCIVGSGGWHHYTGSREVLEGLLPRGHYRSLVVEHEQGQPVRKYFDSTHHHSHLAISSAGQIELIRIQLE